MRFVSRNPRDGVVLLVARPTDPQAYTMVRFTINKYTGPTWQQARVSQITKIRATALQWHWYDLSLTHGPYQLIMNVQFVQKLWNSRHIIGWIGQVDIDGMFRKYIGTSVFLNCGKLIRNRRAISMVRYSRDVCTLCANFSHMCFLCKNVCKNILI